MRQVLTTDHLRAVVEDPHLMAAIAAHHALGDVLAMGAHPQIALAQIVLPRMTEAMQAAWLREIMAGAGEVFSGAGAAIAGGHTTLGAELTIGFTVTGTRDGPAIGIAGATPGDALILTGPIGTGVLLAAEMAHAARGADVAAAWAEMTRGQGAAAQILGAAHATEGLAFQEAQEDPPPEVKPRTLEEIKEEEELVKLAKLGKLVGACEPDQPLGAAHAMTDVTGFGLAGHLLGMLRASGAGAEIDLGAVPVHAGALDLMAAGHRSSLHEANRLAVSGWLTAPEGPMADLLVDPVTAGGLLAAVGDADADRLIAELFAAGYAAARIGNVVEGPPLIAAC